MLFSIAAVLSLAACVTASNINPLRVSHTPAPPKLELTDAQASSGFNGTGFFNQYIDHKNQHLGTFKQQFWWSDEYYKGPGSPVVFFTPGEVAASGYTGYLTNKTITGLFAEAIGGAVVLVEHRYWGNSSPYQNLTTENLQYLTLENSIADFTHFAQTVDFPFDPTHSSNAGKAVSMNPSKF